MADGMSPAEGTKIALCPSGSRGDNQPFIALGLALRRTGYHVHAFTDEGSVPSFQEWDLEATAVRSSFEETITSDMFISAFTKGKLVDLDASPEDLERWSKEEEAKVKSEHKELKSALDEFKPTLMVGNSVSLEEYRKLELQLRVPLVAVHFSPQHLPSEDFPPCCVNDDVVQGLEADTPLSALWVHSFENSARVALRKEKEVAGYGVDPEIMVWMGEIELVESMFARWFQVSDFPVPNVFAYSRHIWPPPAEWNLEQVKVLGNWKICKEDQLGHTSQGSFFGSRDELSRLEAFLAAGPPPVCVGWGSMVVKHPLTMSYLAMKALKLAGQRGILVSSWAKLSPEELGGAPDVEEVREYAKNNVLIVSKAPHEWLLPQCSCLVCHGGAGTCHAAISSGTPVIITPVISDQHYISRGTAKQKLGLACEHLAKVTPEDLAEKIRICSADAEIKANCLRVRDLMAQENGTEETVELIGGVVWAIQAGLWEGAFNAALEGQLAKRRERLALSEDVVISKIDRQMRQLLPEYKKYVDRQAKLSVECVQAMKVEALWVVKASTGVVVRRGESLKSTETGRLSELALLQKLEQKGARMKVKRLRGIGPDEGWVSPHVSGKDVIARIQDMGEFSAVQQELFMRHFGTCGYSP